MKLTFSIGAADAFRPLVTSVGQAPNKPDPTFPIMQLALTIACFVG